MSYPFQTIEETWQKYWEKNGTFTVTEDPARRKLYVLDMFPYPSGAGLHVGHPEGYTATDIYCRYKRMCGFNVLHPMGWDAFGLPAERYAMQTGIHPSITTQQNIANFKRQIRMLGLSYDWSRELNTTDPSYYRWTQWIFLQLYNSWYDPERQKARPIGELKVPEGLSEADRYAYVQQRRLAYLAEMPVNWCAALGTVLANEEVEEWVEKGYTVERRSMRQWMLRITAYAERLARDLEGLEWPPGIIEMQRNWIGRSEGAEISFRLPESRKNVRVFTTRPDTLFGATYMVLAPEHPLVPEVTTDKQREVVEKYRNQAKLKSELDRTALEKEKTGVWTGAFVVNPATGGQIPVWIADYVILTYGTGAIMAVPAHDDRDFAFARKYDLPVTAVVLPPGEWLEAHAPASPVAVPPEALAEAYVSDPARFGSAYCGEGIAVNSASAEVSINEMPTAAAKERVGRWLVASGIGNPTVSYKLRDWLFSRQRYWGEPFPLVYRDDGKVEALSADVLPVVLPESSSFKPGETGESPLASVAGWVHGKGEDGKGYRRETHTMPQWAGSCWYYLRYIDPNNDREFVSKEKERYWMPVDLYIGGAEHAVLHLLYARFWHKVLFDLGHLSTPEPFRRLINQGIILGEDSQKMSKSRGNVVNPDDVVRDYGADSLRLFEMFMGPLVDAKPWSTRGVEGVHRFLNRAWRMLVDEDGNLLPSVREVSMSPEQEKLHHQTVKKVTADIDSLNFNTAISQLMIFVNEFLNADPKPRAAMDQFVLLLSPFAPHLAEELWKKLGHAGTLAYEAWPEYDEAKTAESSVELVVQVNGKVRTKIPIAVDAEEETVRRMVLADANVRRYTEGKEIVRVVVVKNKLVNLVVK